MALRRSVRTAVRTAVLTLLLSASLCVPALTRPAAAADDADLAYRWAPIHYQDTSSAYYSADYLAPVDYDGDWNTLNNWEDLPTHTSGLTGTVYYSIVETGTHWFIVYAFFHPRDWKDYPLMLVSHENDMEGLVEVVRKDGSAYGTLEAAVTLAHDNFYSYTPPGSPYTDGQENIDGSLIMQTYDGAAHPTTFQEARAHGCYNWNGASFPGGDGIVYYPDRNAGTVPTGGNDRSARYHLVNIFGGGGLWDRRSDAQTYAAWGTFAGDNGEDNAAHAPWAWDDWNDAYASGAIASDPAALIAGYFGGIGTFSRDYTRNTYRQ